MAYSIKKVAVLGSGVMGSAIAAHLANAGVPSYLLDIVPKELTADEKAKGLSLQDAIVRNRIVRTGLENAKKAKPAAFYVPELAELITTGNFEDNFHWLSDADWIIEVVVERLDIKRELLKRVDEVRHSGSIVSSNTSGISIASMAEGLSDDFRKHFLGTHFFNPPRYMKLLEIIPTRETLPEVTSFMAEFGERVLGKGIVYCKDTPNFIANRIGVFGMMYTIYTMLNDNYTIEEVDQITGPATGKPKSATFRTGDLVGIDTLVHVAKNLYDAAPHDEMREIFKVPPFLEALVQKKWLGDKTGQGFYKKVKSEGETTIYALDVKTMDYVPSQKVSFPSLETAKQIDDVRERLRIVAKAKDRAGEFFWKTTSALLVYAANRIPEITETIVDIDNAMKWGFNWDLGPFEIWDALGVPETVERMERDGLKVPQSVKEMLASGRTSFYERRDGVKYFYDFFGKGGYKPIEVPRGIIFLDDAKSQKKIIRENAGASLIDIGDGVACLEFHTKMNAIGEDILTMISWSIEEVAKRYEGLVIANEAPNFSAGANLMLILQLAMEEEWDDLARAVDMFHSATTSIKYSEKPVVVAPAGVTVGGGCEITIHAPRVRAAAETYIGLVEVGVGVIPAGGGSKEMLVRSLKRAPQVDGVDLFPFVREVFETIGMAKVATSALEAKKLGYLRESDQITLNRDRLIGDAKQAVLDMAAEGYKKPLPDAVIALGQPALSALELGLFMMREAGYISEYDMKIGKKLAYVLTGGDLSAPQRVSEQYILNLEKEAFLSLCGERKTQERMQYMLKTGKPLRN
ncbi:MAG: 3-hydroxyacyl-CoA dehydrogenase/enoyl-CoA hydratase family protein [Bacteroidota bacterium]